MIEMERNEKRQDFQKSLKLPGMSLMLSGIEVFPVKSSNVARFIKSWLYHFNFIWIFPDLVAEYYWPIEGYREGKTLDEMFLSAPCAIISFLALVKSTALYSNRELLRKVIDKMADIHPEEDEVSNDSDRDGDFDTRCVKQSKQFVYRVIILFSYMCVAVVVMFTLSPFGSMLYEYYNAGATELKLPFRTEYFFDPFTPFKWPLVYIHQIWSSFIVCFNVYGADTTLFAFCIYIEMHFRLLHHTFENVISETSAAETKSKFEIAARRHQDLIELVEQIEELYSKSLFCNIILSSLLICLSGFNITFIDDYGTVFSYVTFLLMSLSQIFLLCFFGDMLMTSSTLIYDAVYNCKWYTADQGIKRSILLVMIRAQRPCRLTAMRFADLNLNAFTTILSRSWSYFALLKTIMDNKN